MTTSARPPGLDDGPVPRHAVEALLVEFLPRQRWYAGTARPRTAVVVGYHVVRTEWPLLIRVVVEADGDRYQVPVGVRPSTADAVEFLNGHDGALLGEVGTDDGRGFAYDAVFDPGLALALLSDTGPYQAERARLMGTEQSNTSIVFDERLILKIFRRLQPGPNPEIEVTEALGRVGFEWVAAPLSVLAEHSFDDVAVPTVPIYGGVDIAPVDGNGTLWHLQVVQPYLAGGVEGWALALTSLRDLFGVHDTQSIPIIDLSAELPPEATDPGEAGGDFSAEAGRLGDTTAALHGAMAEAFGRAPGDARAWADSIDEQVAAAGTQFDFDTETAHRLVGRLRELDDGGPAIRVHGDYHLGQVMRTDAGWYVLDFEGEPARPVHERRRPSSPLRDVAGMLRSFHYAAAVAGAERSPAPGHPATSPGVPFDGAGRGSSEFDELACAWEERNRQSFLDGYLPAAAKAGVIPEDPRAAVAVLGAFELEKAVYELRYERAHRPEWEHIPLTGVRRLLEREDNR